MVAELSASVRKSAKTEKKLYGCWWPHREFLGSGEFLEYLIFLMIFFSKNSAKCSACRNPIDSVRLLSVVLKYTYKVTKMIRESKKRH